MMLGWIFPRPGVAEVPTRVGHPGPPAVRPGLRIRAVPFPAALAALAPRAVRPASPPPGGSAALPSGPFSARTLGRVRPAPSAHRRLGGPCPAALPAFSAPDGSAAGRHFRAPVDPVRPLRPRRPGEAPTTFRPGRAGLLLFHGAARHAGLPADAAAPGRAAACRRS